VIDSGHVNKMLLKIKFGNDCLFGNNVTIWCRNHNFSSIDQPIREQGHSFKPVIIGHDVWIAAHSVILPGITIGDGSVVAAGSVVTKNIPPLSIVAGVPAKVMKKRGE